MAEAGDLTIYGLDVSVYTWIVRCVCAEKNQSFKTVSVNPFAAEPDPVLAAFSPFNRMPVLVHGAFALFETHAITRYLDRAFPVPLLTPETPTAEARMAQVISIIDSYGYWPMVRQVFSEAVFKPLYNEKPDVALIDEGLAKAHPVLGSIDTIAREGLVLGGDARSLADWHLAPMMAYFTMAERGKEALSEYAALSRWWENTKDHAILRQTWPDFSNLPKA